MNCMALELPCAPLGHILDHMFSPRSLNTATGRPVRCKFTGVYVPSSSTPMLTSWSKNAPVEIREDLPNLPPRYTKLDMADGVSEDTGPDGENVVDLDSDSGHSSDTSVDEVNVDSRYIMPLASEAFETVMLELKDEECATTLPMESDNSMSDCSDDSFDFGVHTVYSESPTLDRTQSRVRESECSQLCCRTESETSANASESQGSKHSDRCGLPRRVRFADHMPTSPKYRSSQRSSRLKGSKALKPILKSPSIVH